jgi:hypothetical protein
VNITKKVGCAVSNAARSYLKTRKYIYCGYIFSTRAEIYKKYNVYLKRNKFLDLLMVDIRR